MAKIKLSEKRRQQIRTNFDATKPPKRVNELKYFNKVKAGKIRQETGFKDNKGRFLALPESFTNKYVKQIAEENGKTVKEYLKDKANLRDAKNLFHNKSVSWIYNTHSIDKAINNLKNEIVLLNDGNGTVRMNKAQARLYIQQQLRAVIDEGAFEILFEATLRKEFTELEIYLEDFAGMDEDLDGMIENIVHPNTEIIVSDPTRRKKKKK